MDEKIKNYLGIAIIIGVFALAYAAINYVGTYSKSIEPSAFRSFSASGEGKITAIPDIAQFTFSVITEGGKDPEGKQASYGAGISKLQKENTEKTNKIIEFVKSQGIESKDIKTQNYNLNPRYQYFNCPVPLRDGKPEICPPPEITGYTITQTVLIKIRNFEKISIILSGAVENGANSVSELSFNVDDPTILQDQAREQAIKKAKEKALSIAKASDFKIGRLLSIDEGGYPVKFGGEISRALLSPTIEPGSQEITATITLRYEIK